MNTPKNKSYIDVPEGYKRCCKCLEVKLIDEFGKRNGTPDGKRYDCKECGKARKKRAQQNRSPEAKKRRSLKKNYGITIEDHNRLFIKQKGKCAICGKSHLTLERGLFIDHDHQNNIIRGLLYQQCNLGLGAFFDNPILLTKAAEYLWKKNEN